jgi:CubicO group peptidase (beta-lactamase class C family)
MKLLRREFIRLAAGAVALPSLSVGRSALAQSIQIPDATAVPLPPERDAMANLARAFMQQYDVPAFSVAVGHAGMLVYQDAWGLADRENREAVTPAHLFRIASVSKPITSVTIFSLIEEGHLQLSDKVFGPGGVLGVDYGRPPYFPHVDEITIEHLLTHTCGGWPNSHADPMFMNLEMNHAQLIEWALRHEPLENPPGQHYDYSNFGYCLLGRVIEKITRKPYETYVRDTVLKRCGINDMSIAGNALAQRRPGEVKYYGQGENPYSINITRMDSHGGWIARPADLVQFLMHVDGFATPPNILKPQTIQTMTTASTAFAGYAKGWMVNKANNWYHNGTLAGTSTIAVRTNSGFCWAAFVNTRRKGSPLDGDLDKLAWNMVRQAKGWRV